MGLRAALSGSDTLLLLPSHCRNFSCALHLPPPGKCSERPGGGPGNGIWSVSKIVSAMHSETRSSVLETREVVPGQGGDVNQADRGIWQRS